MDSSLTALEYCINQYNKAPNYSDILKMLIDTEDADRLQKSICAVCILHFNVIGMYRISIFQIWPGPDLVGFVNSNPTGAGAGFENQCKTTPEPE